MSVPQKSVLSAKDVHYNTAGHTIVSGISLSFGAGPMTAIIGVNGAGKSTLLCALGGITKPAAGEVEVSGKSMSSISSKHRARDPASVAQNGVPPAEIRVRDFVSLGRSPCQRLLDGNTAEGNLHADCALALVGLEIVAQRLCGQLSGGQRCRVCLARVITQDSPIILLDESTNHLDMCYQQSVLRLVRPSGACTIAAIRDLDLVMNHLDRVIVVTDGGIAADGVPVDVLTRDSVARTFQVEPCQFNSPSGRRHLAIDSELGAATINQEYSLEQRTYFLTSPVCLSS